PGVGGVVRGQAVIIPTRAGVVKTFATWRECWRAKRPPPTRGGGLGVGGSVPRCGGGPGGLGGDVHDRRLDVLHRLGVPVQPGGLADGLLGGPRGGGREGTAGERGGAVGGGRERGAGVGDGGRRFHVCRPRRARLRGQGPGGGGEKLKAPGGGAPGAFVGWGSAGGGGLEVA